MRFYIDPGVYCYDAAEWGSGSFAGRFAALLDAVGAFSDLEKRVGGERLFSFRWSDELQAGLYENNPFLNDPAKPFYQQQFQSVLYPALMRRMEPCPHDPCGGPCPAPRTAPPVGSGPLAAEFHDLLSLCGACGRSEGACLVYHQDRLAAGLASGFFDREVEVHGGALRLLVPGDLIPLAPCEHADARLALAVEAGLAQRKAGDPAWQTAVATRLIPTACFWRTLHQADFGGLEAHYADRIASTLLQVATGRNESANLHRMTGQTVAHGGRNLPKWNAYVFQSGASDQDRRCSRLYYAKTHDGIVLDEFEPDAHP